jgi:hypothetical protein
LITKFLRGGRPAALGVGGSAAALLPIRTWVADDQSRPNTTEANITHTFYFVIEYPRMAMTWSSVV